MMWKKYKLNELGKIITGSTPKTSNKENFGNDIPFIKPSDFNSCGTLNYQNIGLSFKGSKQSRITKANSVLLVCIGSIGKVGYCDREITTNQQINSIEVNPNVDYKFLYHLLKSSKVQKLILHSASQAILPILNKNNLSNLEVSIPPLDEQRRIMKILDLCSSINENIEICNSKSSTLNSALLIDRFGDLNPKKYKNNNLINLEDVLKKITYGLTVRPKYFEEGVPLIAASQIRNGYIDYISAPKISSEDFDKLSDKCKPKKEDILFSKTGSIGHSAIVGETRNFAIAQNVARLTFDKEKVNSNWMLNVLRSEYIQKLSIIKSKGNAVKDLQLGEIKNFKIFLPPLKKQNEYSYSITYINKLNKKLKERKEILTKLISSIESFAIKVS